MKNNQTVKVNTLAIAIAVVLFGGVSGCNDKAKTSTTVKDNAYYKSMAESLVAKMTTDEKLNMLVGPGYSIDYTVGAAVINTSDVVNLKNDTPGAVGYINGVSNATSGLDIPATILADGPAGIRINKPPKNGDSGTYYTTAFPVGTLLASTWDPEIAKEVGEAAGNEAKEYGIDFWLAPGMNIQRNPLNGRNFEYYSEDPLISGVIASAVVSGTQSEGVGTTIKHFVANNSETNRMKVNNIISPRALREIYLRGFEYAVENAQPWALMTTYNKVNGAYTGQRADLLTGILRNEWGFHGLVMSDWWAGDDSLAMVKAGNDLIQAGGTNLATGEQSLDVLKTAYANGQLSSDIITRDTVHILTQALKTPTHQNYALSNNPDLNAHAKIAKKAAKEGIVLLKNDSSTLPIATSKTIASFGITQINTLKGGSGSGDVISAYVRNIIDGLSNQFSVDLNLKAFYESYFAGNKKSAIDAVGTNTIISCTEPSLSIDEVNTYALANDIAVISIGRMSGEGNDRKNEKGDYLLSDTEQSLIDNVSTAFHNQRKKVVVVLNVTGVIDTSTWKDKVDAILLTYLPGQEAGDAIVSLPHNRTSYF